MSMLSSCIYIAVTVPDTPVPDVYEVNDNMEIAVANIVLKDVEFRRENIRVMLGGKKPGKS